MSRLSAAQKYQAVKIESATRGQILLALYDGCIRFCRAATMHIEDGDPAAKGIAISRALAVIGELRSTLDHSAAPELCESLDRLYLFFQEQLMQANLNMDAAPIVPVVRLLQDLRDAWAQAVENVEGSAA